MLSYFRKKRALVPFGAPLATTLAAALVLSHVPVTAHEVHEAHVVPKSDFALPAPGTYRLERIMRAPAGTVLDVDGKALPLSRFTTGKITVLSFMYTRCNDAKGCPYAFVVFHLLKDAIDAAPALEGRVRLVSLSFDPAHDTPEVMRRYGAGESGGSAGVQWRFLTTSGQRALVPLLEGFGQDVSVAANALPPDHAHASAGYAEFSHVLKVFLIDKSGVIREIYSTSFLKPRVVMNDIETLAMEENRANREG